MTAPELAAPVEDLWARPWTHMQARTRNALRRAGVDTLGDLLGRHAWELLDQRAFGLACLAEVRRALRARGLALLGDSGGEAA